MVGLLNKFIRGDARKIIPVRKETANKTAGGRCLIVAGSEGMFGAAVLSATAAARVGAGYVILLTDAKKFNSCKNPDFLIADARAKKIDENDFSAAAIGPGLGKSRQALQLLKELLKVKRVSVVIDADALNLFAAHFSGALPAHWIATPHEGELARLTGLSAAVIRKDRMAAVKKAQKKLGCVLLLKGSKTLVATSSRVFEVQSGNKALAKAGTGDVLTGMIAGLLSQGCGPEQAACLGAFIHGYIADEWIKEKNDYLSLMAGDLLQRIPQALAKLRK